MLTSSQRSQLGAVAKSYLLDSTDLTLLPATVGARDVEGRTTLSWPAVDDVEAIPFRGAIKVDGDAIQAAGTQLEVTPWVVRAGVDVTVTVADRIADPDGHIFEVTGVHVVRNFLGALYQTVNCREIDGSVL